MEQGTIEKENLYNVLKSEGKNRIFAAVINSTRGVEFKEADKQTNILLDYSNSKLSPKGLFFPQREVLCTYEQELLKGTPEPEQSIVLFGIRPCDALALTYLDKIFSGSNEKFKDPYYLQRRENALIISLACREPALSCFCTSVGGSPSGKQGADILVHELKDKLLFESCSPKGEAFMKKDSSYFTKSLDEDIMTVNKRSEEIKAGMSLLESAGLDGFKEKLDKGFDDPVWENMTRSCIGCGTCTYLCPTCHCFDISDEENNKGQGCRIRTWDSCQYPLFTLHASGHNPRVNKKQRMRQRIMHKFSYTVDTSENIFCVGCGRCVINCPVNLDIRDMIKTLNKL
jgi:formate hydrogenlyase subunit 6/NADH:ubiquinone oxidoreductase subunit I